MNRPLDTPSSGQCSECKHWSRLHLRQEMGRCYSPDRKPDAEYGLLVLDSDGCKFWQPERPEAA